ncbi:unnamed protein product [Prunus brigantina]
MLMPSNTADKEALGISVNCNFCFLFFRFLNQLRMLTYQNPKIKRVSLLGDRHSRKCSLLHICQSHPWLLWPAFERVPLRNHKVKIHPFTSLHFTPRITYFLNNIQDWHVAQSLVFKAKIVAIM